MSELAEIYARVSGKVPGVKCAGLEAWQHQGKWKIGVHCGHSDSETQILSACLRLLPAMRWYQPYGPRHSKGDLYRLVFDHQDDPIEHASLPIALLLAVEAAHDQKGPA